LLLLLLLEGRKQLVLLLRTGRQWACVLPQSSRQQQTPLGPHRREGRLLELLEVILMILMLMLLMLMLLMLLLLLLLVLLEHCILESQVVAPIDEQLVLEVAGRVHVLAGVARAAALDAVVAGDHAPIWLHLDLGRRVGELALAV